MVDRPRYARAMTCEAGDNTLYGQASELPDLSLGAPAPSDEQGRLDRKTHLSNSEK